MTHRDRVNPSRIKLRLLKNKLNYAIRERAIIMIRQRY